MSQNATLQKNTTYWTTRQRCISTSPRFCEGAWSVQETLHACIL